MQYDDATWMAELTRMTEVARILLDTYRSEAGGTPYDDDVSPPVDCGFATGDDATVFRAVARQYGSTLGGSPDLTAVLHLSHWHGNVLDGERYARRNITLARRAHFKALGITAREVAARPTGRRRGRPKGPGPFLPPQV